MTDHPALAGLEALDRGHQPNCRHPDDACVCVIALFDLRAALAAAREAPGEVEVREQWGVRYPDDDTIEEWCCESCAYNEIRERGGGVAVTRTRTRIRDHFTPWREA